MNLEQLEADLKQFIISTLALEDISPEQIESDTPLFGDGLGLDSVDALEIGVALQKHYNVKIDVNSPDTRSHFANIRNLAAFVAAQRSQS